MSDQTQNILEPGGNEVATAAGGARRYRKPLKSFRWHDIKCLFIDSFGEWNKHNAPRLGASLSFYTLLSLAPLLVVLVSVVGIVVGIVFPNKVDVEASVIRQFEALVGPQGAGAAQLLIAGSRHTAHGILAAAFGVVTLLFGASGVLVELRDALNIIWDVPTPERSGMKKITGFLKERLFSFALVLAIGFLLVVSLAVSTWIAALGAYSASILPLHELTLQVINFVISFSVTTGLFSAIYKFLPDIKLEWEDVVLGGAVTSLLFTLGKFVLGIYLGRATFASTYGAAASIVVLIVWVYYSAQIFFLGAEFTKIFANCYRSQPSAHPQGMVVDHRQASVPAEAPHILTPADAVRPPER